MFVHQSGVAVLETDHELTNAKAERVKAELRAIGIEAVILPVGMSLVHAAVQGMDDEGDDE